MRAVLSFALNDLRTIRRDPFLLYVMLIPAFMIGLLRVVIPPVEHWLLTTRGIDLAAYHDFIVGFIVFLQLPMLFGVVFGLIILDERDDRVLKALAVTPVSVRTYMNYRLGLGIVCSMVYVWLVLPFTNLTPAPIIASLLPVGLLSGMFSVILLLLLGIFADNKVEGMALMKAFGILLLGPLAAYFMAEKWEWLFWVFPSYWPAKICWLAYENAFYWGHFAAGFLYMSGWIAGLFVLWRRKSLKIA